MKERRKETRTGEDGGLDGTNKDLGGIVGESIKGMDRCEGLEGSDLRTKTELAITTLSEGVDTTIIRKGNGVVSTISHLIPGHIVDRLLDRESLVIS
jgi:hypothetical protein